MDGVVISTGAGTSCSAPSESTRVAPAFAWGGSSPAVPPALTTVRASAVLPSGTAPCTRVESSIGADAGSRRRVRSARGGVAGAFAAGRVPEASSPGAIPPAGGALRATARVASSLASAEASGVAPRFEMRVASSPEGVLASDVAPCAGIRVAFSSGGGVGVLSCANTRVLSPISAFLPGDDEADSLSPGLADTGRRSVPPDSP